MRSWLPGVIVGEKQRALAHGEKGLRETKMIGFIDHMKMCKTFAEGDEDAYGQMDKHIRDESS